MPSLVAHQAAPDGPSEAAVEDDRRRQQGGAADTKKKAQDNENGQSGPSKGKDKEPTKNGAGAGAKPTGACAAEAMDGELQAGGSSGSRLPASKSRSPKAEAAKASKPKAQGRSGSDHSVSDYDSESATSGARRRKRREEAGLKAATGFGLAPSCAQASFWSRCKHLRHVACVASYEASPSTSRCQALSNRATCSRVVPRGALGVGFLRQACPLCAPRTCTDFWSGGVGFGVAEVRSFQPGAFA